MKWHNAKGLQRRGHRPDLVVLQGDQAIPVEVELARKSAERLKAILSLHAAWWRTGKTNGVLDVCGDRDCLERVRDIAARVRLSEGGGGLRLELLDAFKAQAMAWARLARDNPEACRLKPGTQLPLFGG